MKRSEVFSAVNSAEQLRDDLENPLKTSSTNDYLIASNVNSDALHGGQRPIQAQPTSCSFLTSHTTTSTNPGTRNPYLYSSCDWDFPVNSAFNDPLDQMSLPPPHILHLLRWNQPPSAARQDQFEMPVRRTSSTHK